MAFSSLIFATVTVRRYKTIWKRYSKTSAPTYIYIVVFEIQGQAHLYIMLQQLTNTSQDYPFFLVYGFLMIPKNYKLHRDVVKTFITVICLASVIVNSILLLVTVKDPFRQFRKVSSILLGFNSATNFSIAVFSLLEKFPWFDQKLILYLNSCVGNLYFIGNVLHILNVYGTIVTPIRYKLFESATRKTLIPTLVITWIAVYCAIFIPPYTLPERKIPLFLKTLLTITSVSLVLLIIVFTFCYARVFQNLRARKQLFSSTFNVKNSCRQGVKILRQHCNLATTLFIHVLFFVILAAPGCIFVMMFLHCTSCDVTTLQLGVLYAVSALYLLFVINPIMWFYRLQCYRRAFRKILC